MATSRDSAVAAAASVARARQTLAARPRRPGRRGGERPRRDDTRRSTKYGPLLDSYLHGERAAARDPRLGRPEALPGPDPGPRRAPPNRRFHRQLRRSSPSTRGGSPSVRFQNIFHAGPAVDLPVHHATPGARRLPARPDAVLAARRRELVARLPDQRPGRDPALHERVGRHADRRRPRRSPRTRIDELLKVTGPITVPEYDLHDRVRRDDPEGAPGHLGRCRQRPGEPQGVPVGRSRTGSSRRSSRCRPRSGATLLGDAETFRQGRLLEAWFRDPADEAFVAGSGFDGAVRQDPGDYLYPVDSNVAPDVEAQLL